MALSTLPPEGISSFFAREVVVDMSQFPVELVAAHQEAIRLAGWREMLVSHPDLWHDGRWIEK